MKDVGLSPEHYIRLIVHRWWLVLGIALAISAGTIVFSHFLPNVYTSDTVILVDPQKVPDAYVKSTVTGDVRNRLSTLSQQILSATRLQRIIETLNLYPEDRKKAAREDVIAHMRADISVQVVSDFGASQDFQAFRITYSGKDARLVAQVTNELASLFIEENLKAREQQATGHDGVFGEPASGDAERFRGPGSQVQAVQDDAPRRNARATVRGSFQFWVSCNLSFS